MRLLTLILLLAAPAALAQICPGDCDGDGVVRIDELVGGVRIALGDAPLADCPAFDTTPDGVVRIDELVGAASAALAGCPAPPVPTDTPAATDTPSPSATPTPTGTATPTATPTVPDVSGAWHEDPLAIVSSSCLDAFTAFLAQRFSMRGCDQTVATVDETRVQVGDCSSQSVESALDRNGTIHVVFPSAGGEVCLIDDSEESCPSEALCRLALDVSSTIPAATSPTVAHYTFDLGFSGACADLEACTVQADGTWTRLVR
ncbi:MAG: hypothetical protein ABI629_26745 [bacterium]